MIKLNDDSVRDYFCLPTDKLIKQRLDRKEDLQSVTMTNAILFMQTVFIQLQSKICF